MKKGWRYASLVIFLCLLLLGCVTVNSIVNIQLHGKLINYAGIVRGATQRLIKRELNDIPSDDILLEVDAILNNLLTGEGEHGLPLLDDDEYLKAIHKQKDEWERLKKFIYLYRDDKTTYNNLYKSSELYFELADDTVFAAESYSEGHTKKIMYLNIMLFASVLILWLFIFITNIRKIMKLEGFNRSLKDKTGRDSLTQAYNVEYFQQIAQNLINTNHQYKYAIFYMDFADFKYINDVFGYTVGDNILINYAKVLMDDRNEDECVGRVSADNFVVLRKYQNKEDLINEQRKLDNLFTQYMRSTLNKQSISIRCGICCIEDVAENLKIDELMTRANFARKAAKTDMSQSYYRFYDEGIREQLFVEKAIESSFGEAFSNQEFIVYYQPKVDVKTKNIVAAEALVRWQKADGTFLYPNSFIPVFEKNNTIDQLDQYVFEKVCQWLKSKIEKQERVVSISVNVSRLQFYNVDFVEIYKNIKNKYNIPDGLLEIEFTESIVYDNWKHLSRIVDDLHVSGFLCSIDDFGKGSSSLSMIKNLDIDVLKIDAMFFQNLDESNKDKMLVSSLIQLAKKFNINTVAEGIETEKQVEFLREHDCDLIQGYVFYKPMSQSDFDLLLNESIVDKVN